MTASTNTREKANEWVQLLATLPEVPFGSRLLEHFAAGHLTRLCECGCNSFDCEVPAIAALAPLCPPSQHGGLFFEVVLETNAGSDVACLFFADPRGYLAGIDVTYGEANHGRLPPGIQVGRVRCVIDHIA